MRSLAWDSSYARRIAPEHYAQLALLIIVLWCSAAGRRVWLSSQPAALEGLGADLDRKLTGFINMAFLTVRASNGSLSRRAETVSAGSHRERSAAMT